MVGITKRGVFIIDTSVLLENTGPEWHIFHILTSEDIDDISRHFLLFSPLFMQTVDEKWRTTDLSI